MKRVDCAAAVAHVDLYWVGIVEGKGLRPIINVSEDDVTLRPFGVEQHRLRILSLDSHADGVKLAHSECVVIAVELE